MDSSVPIERITLARAIAVQHSLDPQLVCAVIEQESEWNPWAVRYEPGFLGKYVASDYIKGLITATQAYTRSMSFGLMQVMGLTAVELGFKGKFLTELCDPAVGVEFGCRKLAKTLARANDDVNAALQAYNGGSNPSYFSQVLARLGNYAA